MNKNVILCFSCIHPAGLNKYQIVDRENNYELALEWLLKTIPENWDIVYNDNSLESLDELLSVSFKDKLDKLKVILHKNNEGVKNKGAGEQDMCKKCFNSIDYDKYNWIVYFTARHIIPNSWYFDKLESEWSTFDAIMSNPSFYYLNYSQIKSEKGLYNDMIFSMKTPVFKNFIDSIDIEELKVLQKNSENHLYEFINNYKVNKKEIDYLGILRNDHQSQGWHLI